MSGWTDPASSFSSETVDGPATGPAWGTMSFGSVIDHERVMNSHAAQVIAVSGGGTDSGIQVSLQGSLDGSTFYLLAGPAMGSQLLVAEDTPAKFVRADATVSTLYGGQGIFNLTVLVVAQESE
jgi:hypothetical protein